MLFVDHWSLLESLFDAKVVINSELPKKLKYFMGSGTVRPLLFVQKVEIKSTIWGKTTIFAM
jgi:hypothetical protein